MVRAVVSSVEVAQETLNRVFVEFGQIKDPIALTFPGPVDLSIQCRLGEWRKDPRMGVEDLPLASRLDLDRRLCKDQLAQDSSHGLGLVTGKTWRSSWLLVGECCYSSALQVKGKFLALHGSTSSLFAEDGQFLWTEYIPAALSLLDVVNIVPAVY